VQFSSPKCTSQLSTLHHFSLSQPDGELQELHSREQSQRDHSHCFSKGSKRIAQQIFFLSNKVFSFSKQANGFYTAKDISRYVPMAYSMVEEALFNEIEATKQQERIKLMEYVRPDWTFHGKGLWYVFPKESVPFITLIGSANFGMFLLLLWRKKTQVLN
jgi:hypothetical protein